MSLESEIQVPLEAEWGKIPLLGELKCLARAKMADALIYLQGSKFSEKFSNQVAERVFKKHKIHLTGSTIRAIRMVDRREFVPPIARGYAHKMVPLPIGAEQTISSPDIVGIMIDLLGIEHDSEILEIGSGSGYSAVVMSNLTTRNVTSLEIRPELERLAGYNVKNSKSTNICIVNSRNFDKYKPAENEAINMQAFPEKYDRIISCSEMAHRGEAEKYLVKLAPNGRFLAPMKATDGEVYFFTYTHQDGWKSSGIKTEFVPHVSTE